MSFIKNVHCPLFSVTRCFRLDKKKLGREYKLFSIKYILFILLFNFRTFFQIQNISIILRKNFYLKCCILVKKIFLLNYSLSFYFSVFHYSVILITCYNFYLFICLALPFFVNNFASLNSLPLLISIDCSFE